MEKLFRDFQDLRTHVFELYRAGQFAEFLAVIDRNLPFFPQEEAVLTNWRICMQSILGDVDGALRTFRSALDRGYWWSEQLLRTDSDLERLQGNPEFEKLLAESVSIGQRAAREAKPSRLIFHPEGSEASERFPLLVGLHGHGGNLHSNEEYLREANNLGWRVALLGSSQTNGTGMYHWDDYERGGREVRQQIEEICQIFPTDEERIVIAGFSQSGFLVAWWTLRNELPSRRFIAICPASLEAGAFDELEKTAHFDGLRGIIAAGGEDRPWIQTAEHLKAFMGTHQLSSIYQLYPEMGHTFPPDWKDRLPLWLDFLTKS